MEEEKIIFDGGMIPSLSLFEGEKILGAVEAGLWEIGLIGFLFRYKESLIVTTHRIFQFSRKLTSSNLKCLELSKVESIHVGSKLNIIQFIVGIFILAWSVYAGVSRLFYYFLYGAFSRLSFFELLILFISIIGFILLITASKKVLQISGSGVKNFVALPFSHKKIEESRRFVDLVAKAIRGLNK